MMGRGSKNDEQFEISSLYVNNCYILLGIVLYEMQVFQHLRGNVILGGY